MTKNLRDMPRITQREERGYRIIGVTGVIDVDIYPEHKGERSFLDDFRERVLSAGLDKPIALDVSDCRFHTSESLGLFTEAYRLFKRKVITVYGDNDHLTRLLARTHLENFVELYKTIDELPQSTSSR